jgi:AcrR family transcriptional regulator
VVEKEEWSWRFFMKDFESRKEEIVEIAGQLFDKLGYESTSMSKIAQALGSGKASLYYYFKSKEELLLNVLKREGFRYFEANRKYLEEEKDILKKLKFYLCIPAQISERHSGIMIKMYFKIMKIRIKRARQLADEMLETFFSNFREMLDEGIQSGVIRSDLDIERFMLVIFSNLNSLLFIEVPGISKINDIKEKRLNYEYMLDLMLEGIKK